MPPKHSNDHLQDLWTKCPALKLQALCEAKPWPTPPLIPPKAALTLVYGQVHGQKRYGRLRGANTTHSTWSGLPAPLYTPHTYEYNVMTEGRPRPQPSQQWLWRELIEFPTDRIYGPVPGNPMQMAWEQDWSTVDKAVSVLQLWANSNCYIQNKYYKQVNTNEQVMWTELPDLTTMLTWHRSQGEDTCVRHPVVLHVHDSHVCPGMQPNHIDHILAQVDRAVQNGLPPLRKIIQIGLPIITKTFHSTRHALPGWPCTILKAVQWNTCLFASILYKKRHVFITTHIWQYYDNFICWLRTMYINRPRSRCKKCTYMFSLTG